VRSTLLDSKPMDEVAIDRLKCFEAEALEMHPDGYWLADSFGKDSCVIYDLFDRAGVRGEKHHNTTTADPPELIWFGKKHHPDTIIDKPPLSMWQLIRKKKGMPTGMRAWCCEKLKERSGSDRITITGVRSAESPKRQARRVMEVCWGVQKGRRVLNPIVDWPTDAVWEYIRERKLPYCELYDEGFTRLGCVCCPKARRFDIEAARWPRLADAWKRGCFAAWELSDTQKKRFATPDAMWEWWKNGCRGAYDSDPVLFEDDSEASA
jgi:phosphoadenosine phosphosulfate reductase